MSTFSRRNLLQLRTASRRARLQSTGLVYVSQQGSDTQGDGSQNAPYASLDMALRALPEAGGFEIIVGAGVYHESSGGTGALRLDRAFVNEVKVRAEEGARVTVTCGCENVGFVLGLLSGAANMTFENIGFEGNELLTVFGVNNSSGIRAIRFRGCTISNGAPGGSAVYFYQNEAAQCSFTDCVITARGANSAAVALSGRAGAGEWLDEFSFADCVVSGQQYGLRLLNSGYVRNLTLVGGEYRAEAANGAAIGQRGAAASGPMENIALSGVVVRGNGRGIDLGAAQGVQITTLTLAQCDVDTTAGQQCGLLLGGGIVDATINGGVYRGGEAGSSYGAVYLGGPESSNFQVLNADIASQAPDPAANRVPALAITGTAGVVIGNCIFSGDGPGIVLLGGVSGARIALNRSSAEDFGLRVGSDGGEVYACDDLVVSNNQFTALLTAALIIGKGAKNVVVEDNVMAGGPAILRLRGTADSENIVLRRNTFRRSEGYEGERAAAVQAFGMQGTSWGENTIVSDYPALFDFRLQEGLVNDNNVIRENTFEQSGGLVFRWEEGSAGVNNVLGPNEVTLNDGAQMSAPSASGG